MNIEDLNKVIFQIDNNSNEFKNEFINNIGFILNNLIKNKEIQKKYFFEFNQVINDWNNIYFQNQKRILNNLEISKWEYWYFKLQENKKRSAEDGLDFNVFNLFQEKLGISIQETMHSKLIKFLLDENEIHGQRNKFLIKFLELLNINNPSLGKWQVTVEQGRVDVLIKRNYPYSVIILENKSNWAIDQPNQLYRYWFYTIYKNTKEFNTEYYKYNKDRFKIIYLVPNENKLYNENSVTKPIYNSGLCDMETFNKLPFTIPMEIITWSFNKEFQIWIEECINILPKSNYRIKEYLEQYKILTNTL